MFEVSHQRKSLLHPLCTELGTWSDKGLLAGKVSERFARVAGHHLTGLVGHYCNTSTSNHHSSSSGQKTVRVTG